MDFDDYALVIDNGSTMTRIGWAGEDNPSVQFPALIGRPKYYRVMPIYSNAASAFVGDAAQNWRGVLALTYPIQHGVVQNWDDLELLWNYMFATQMQVNPTEHNVLLSEALLNPKNHRERLTETMFESFGVPKLLISTDSVLQTYASGRLTGCMVNVGGGVATVMPICEGYAMLHAAKRSNVAGDMLTDCMAKQLSLRGPLTFATGAEREIARDVKEQWGYVAVDYEQERTTKPWGIQKSFMLPDGQTLRVDIERFNVPEALFQPSLVGSKEDGIHDLILQAINACAVDVRADLRCNIVTYGQSTRFPGFNQRLHKELRAQLPPTKLFRLAMATSSDRQRGVWTGGSILALLDAAQQQFMTKAEYDEEGPQLVHRKCF